MAFTSDFLCFPWICGVWYTPCLGIFPHYFLNTLIQTEFVSYRVSSMCVCVTLIFLINNAHCFWQHCKFRGKFMYVMDDTEDKIGLGNILSIYCGVSKDKKLKCGHFPHVATNTHLVFHCFIFFAYNTFDSIQRPQDIWSCFGSSNS